MGWRSKIWGGGGSRVTRNPWMHEQWTHGAQRLHRKCSTEREPVLVVGWESRDPRRGCLRTEKARAGCLPSAPHTRLRQEGARGPRLDESSCLGWHAGCSKSTSGSCAQDPPTPQGAAGPKVQAPLDLLPRTVMRAQAPQGHHCHPVTQSGHTRAHHQGQGSPSTLG